MSRVRRGLVIRRFQEAAAATRTGFAARLAFAQVLLAAGEWQTAAVEFASAAELAPLDVASKWGLARAFAALGKTGEAAAELRAALALSRAADETYQLARELTAAAVRAGDVEAELEGRRAALRVRPDPGAILELAATLNNTGHHDKAAALLADRAATMARTPEQRARWALAEGRSRAAGGDLERAAAALAGAGRHAPARARALCQEIWNLRVEVARRRGALDELARELAHPRDGVEWTARAQVADEQGDLRGAWAALEEAVRLSPRDLGLQKREIALARRVGSPTEAAALYQRLVASTLGQRGGDDPAAVVDALDGLWELGRSEIAGRVFDRVLLARGRAAGADLLRALGDMAARWGDDRRAERCWTELLRGNPGDEVALVALGEIQLQRGQRQSALATWRRVLRVGGARRADAHARLAEILADHEFGTQALVEARAAVELDRSEPRFHRSLASTLERQERLLDAESEWETVLRLARDPGRASERHEARTRLLGLWIRGGSARVALKLQTMEQLLANQQQQHGNKGGSPGDSDREMLIFLVQAQLRTGRTDAALALMKRALGGPYPRGNVEEQGEERPPERGPTSEEDASADADLILLLVRTLRQVHRPDEAMRWLEQLSLRFPERAREAQLQLADLALAEHADQRARYHAQQAVASSGEHHRSELRAAAVQERLGHLDEAALMYRRLLKRGGPDPAAALRLAGLLGRSGETEEQRMLLEEAVRTSVDEETVASAGMRAIVLAEASGAGTLEALEGLIADTPDLNGSGAPAAARRRLLAAVLWRLVPAVYRRRLTDPVAAVKVNRFARDGLRPLLELANAPDSVSDPRAIELIGMLGRVEAVPALSRLLVPDAVERAGEPAASGPGARGPALKDDLASIIVVALGRLGGELARVTLESFAQRNESSSRLALLWALGRVGGPVAIERARQELTGSATDGGIVACLSLGRAGGE
ncbi:MAG: tetratricopeptide repeat protein, partial [Polyangia bacterium]